MARTRMSTKGQVVIPSPIRGELGWEPGTELEVVARGGELVLKPVSSFPPTRLEDVVGCTGYRGPPVPIEAMDEAIARRFRRRKA